MMTQCRKIMVVDDEEEVNYIIFRLLKKEGYDVLTARTVEAGLFYLKNDRPCIVLCDMRIGDDMQAGEKFLKEAKMIDKGIPIFIISGLEFQEDSIERLKRLGADEVWPKPFGEEHVKRL